MGTWRWVYILTLAPTVALYPFAVWYSRGIDIVFFEQWLLVGCLVLTIAVSRGLVRRLRWRYRLLAVGIPFQFSVLFLYSLLGLVGRRLTGESPGKVIASHPLLWLFAGSEASYGAAFYLLLLIRARLRRSGIRTNALPA